MQLVNGHTLQAVTDLPDPAVLYDKLIRLLIKFANHGVIHGDFNEFNIMLDTRTADPIIIDFPQVRLVLVGQQKLVLSFLFVFKIQPQIQPQTLEFLSKCLK